MISNELLKGKILDEAIHGRLVENNPSLEPIDVQKVNDNIPFEIPNNWKWSYLKNNCEKLYAGGDKPLKFSKEKTNELSVPVIANGINNDGIIGYTDIPTEEDNCLTISGRGTIGYASIRNYPFTPIVRLITIKPKGYLNIKYLKCVMSYATQSSKGTSIPQLTIPMIKNKLIPIPPLEEQDKIVKKIEELFELIDKKEKNDEEKEKIKILLKEKILNSAICGELIENDLTLPAIDVEEAKEDIPFDIPSNWKWSYLKNNCEKLYAGGDKPLKFSKEKNNELSVPVIANGINNDGIIGYTDIPTEMDNCLTISGRGTIGYASIRNYPFTPIVRLITIKPKEYLNIKYLKSVMSYATESSKGTSIPQLTIPMIKNKLIPIPPLEQQKKIVEKIEECFKLIEQL